MTSLTMNCLTKLSEYLFQVQGDVRTGQREALHGMRETVALEHRHAVADSVSRVKHHTFNQNNTSGGILRSRKVRL